MFIISLGKVRAEKKEKKHFEKQKKAMGLGGGTSMIKPKEPAKPVGTIFNMCSFERIILNAGNVIGRTARH